MGGKRGKDWVPRPDEEYDKFFKNYCQVVVMYCTGSDSVWTHIPIARITGLSAALAGWDAAYTKLDGPRTPGDFQAKKEARKSSEKVLRAFNRQYILYAEEVTDAQRREIGCPVHAVHSTQVPRPDVQAEADRVLPGSHTVERWIKKLLSLEADSDRAIYGVRIFLGSAGRARRQGQFPHHQAADQWERPAPLRLHQAEKVPLRLPRGRPR
jgi:hypothetical protein